LSLYVNGTSITSRQLYTGTSAPTSIPTEASLLVNDNTTSGTVNGASAPVQGFFTEWRPGVFGLYSPE